MANPFAGGFMRRVKEVFGTAAPVEGSAAANAARARNNASVGSGVRSGSAGRVASSESGEISAFNNAARPGNASPQTGMNSSFMAPPRVGSGARPASFSGGEMPAYQAPSGAGAPVAGEVAAVPSANAASPASQYSLVRNRTNAAAPGGAAGAAANAEHSMVGISLDGGLKEMTIAGGQANLPTMLGRGSNNVSLETGQSYQFGRNPGNARYASKEARANAASSGNLTDKTVSESHLTVKPNANGSVSVSDGVMGPDGAIRNSTNGTYVKDPLVQGGWRRLGENGTPSTVVTNPGESNTFRLGTRDQNAITISPPAKPGARNGATPAINPATIGGASSVPPANNRAGMRPAPNPANDAPIPVNSSTGGGPRASADTPPAQPGSADQPAVAQATPTSTPDATPSDSAGTAVAANTPPQQPDSPPSDTTNA